MNPSVRRIRDGVLVTVLAVVSLECMSGAPVRSKRRTLRPATRADIVQMVVEAERRRLVSTVLNAGRVDSFINVAVNRTGEEVIPNVAFFEAHNTQVDPPARYVVAQNADGSLFKVGGFDDGRAEFNRLVTNVLGDGPTSDRDILRIVDAYFAVVEGWARGPVSKSRSAGNRNDCRTRVVSRSGHTISTTVFLHDRPSGRAECVTVNVSAKDGVTIVSRTMLQEGTRIEL